MSGYAPLTEATLRYWSERAGLDDLTDDEAELMFLLDRVLCGFDASTYSPNDALMADP